jgi:rod shape determining protein RodA
MRKENSLVAHMDWALFVTYMILLIIGMATVYSVAYNEEHPNIFEYSEKYGKQLMWLGISLFLGLMVFLIDSDIYRKFSVPIYLFTLLLLVIVLFTPKINGASAWLGIGPFGVQPAEFAKIGTALLLARFISTVNVKQQNIQTVLIANAIILIPMVLILFQFDCCCIHCTFYN